MPLLGDARHKEMLNFLREVTPALGRPAVILVISAHWEESRPTVTGSAFPPLIYDYHGFPKESYEIQYPVPGHPGLAGRILKLLESRGIEATLDEQRGFDHGLFVPLKIMYPNADIPCVQLSLLNSLNPEAHIRMGKALAALRSENVLIIGSGFSFHNLKAFFFPPSTGLRSMNDSFQQWLVDTCSDAQISEEAREKRLIEWESAPEARGCHPREEHLLPLHVCYGAAGSAARQVFEVEIMGFKSSAFLW